MAQLGVLRANLQWQSLWNRLLTSPTFNRTRDPEKIKNSLEFRLNRLYIVSFVPAKSVSQTEFAKTSGFRADVLYEDGGVAWKPFGAALGRSKR